jgi:hypothetical protein
MIQGYYTARGWTAEGRIPVQKLAELELLEMGRNDAEGGLIFESAA